MGFGTFRVAGTALVAAAMLTSAPVSAQARRGGPHPDFAGHQTRDGYPRQGYDDRDPFDRDSLYRAAPRRADPRERCNRGNAGSILGAIAGGLLGNAAAGRRAGPSGPAGRTTDHDC